MQATGYPLLFSPDSCTRIVFIDLLILSLLFSNWVLVFSSPKSEYRDFLGQEPVSSAMNRMKVLGIGAF